MLDLNELIKRAFKYIIHGLLLAIVAFSIPKQKLNIMEVLVIGLSAAATFSILDTFLPSIAAGARQGAGLAIGTGLGGGLKIA